MSMTAGPEAGPVGLQPRLRERQGPGAGSGRSPPAPIRFQVAARPTGPCYALSVGHAGGGPSRKLPLATVPDNMIAGRFYTEADVASDMGAVGVMTRNSCPAMRFYHRYH